MVVVVSWTASSIRRVWVGVLRMLSWMFAPSTIMLFSKELAPEIVTAPLGPLLLTPGARLTAESIVRAVGSLLSVSPV